MSNVTCQAIGHIQQFGGVHQLLYVVAANFMQESHDRPIVYGFRKLKGGKDDRFR